MSPVVAGKLLEMAKEAGQIEHRAEFDRWTGRVKSFLSQALGVDESHTFALLGQSSVMNLIDWPETLAMRQGHLEGLVARAAVVEENAKAALTKSIPEASAERSGGRKVFVVHGHDDAAKEGVARFIEKVGRIPIILHEQPSSGRTVIEKFEIYSDDVVFAVVLLTPDDMGSESGGVARPRARQNVIMELGYFIGRLGRTRVCALYKGNIELPSDYQGVLYVAMDSAGAWKTSLAQELVQSKISIDLNGLIRA